MRIRRADDRDVAELARLREHWYRESTEDGFADRFAEWYAGQRGRRVAFVAEPETGGGLVGMMHLAVVERMPRPGQPDTRWGYLSNAFVLPGHRGRGVGRALLDALMAYARERGCVRVVLSPSDRAVPFYARAGFGPATMLMAQVLQ